MSIGLIRGLYDYHWWANRRLFDVAAALGPEATREVGSQFSFPTLKGMLAHIYAADWVWMQRFKGASPTKLPGDTDFADLAALRARWDDFEMEQRAFIGALGETDLARTIEYRNTEGKSFTLALGRLLEHVANHATHHRSEVATMLTMIAGSPPATDRVLYELIRTGQRTA